jgi:hypothetical protein
VLSDPYLVKNSFQKGSRVVTGFLDNIKEYGVLPLSKMANEMQTMYEFLTRLTATHFVYTGASQLKSISDNRRIDFLRLVIGQTIKIDHVDELTSPEFKYFKRALMSHSAFDSNFQS